MGNNNDYFDGTKLITIDFRKIYEKYKHFRYNCKHNNTHYTIHYERTLNYRLLIRIFICQTCYIRITYTYDLEKKPTFLYIKSDLLIEDSIMSKCSNPIHRPLNRKYIHIPELYDVNIKNYMIQLITNRITYALLRDYLLGQKQIPIKFYWEIYEYKTFIIGPVFHTSLELIKKIKIDSFFIDIVRNFLINTTYEQNFIDECTQSRKWKIICDYGYLDRESHVYRNNNYNENGYIVYFVDNQYLIMFNLYNYSIKFCAYYIHNHNVHNPIIVILLFVYTIDNHNELLAKFMLENKIIINKQKKCKTKICSINGIAGFSNIKRYIPYKNKQKEELKKSQFINDIIKIICDYL